MPHVSALFSRFSFTWALISLIWLIPLAFFFLNRWDQDLAPVDRTYLLRAQTCKASYREQDAQDRCLLIMELEHFQSRSIMTANRVLACAAPPLIGLGLLVYLRRRRSQGRSRGKGQSS
ncbi:hypothetical protein [Roseibium sp.]|uniref:hypothetical protein n=1 Tax=Roseibium sp. TaxID=1936156 RepID=UPI0032991A15